MKFLVVFALLVTGSWAIPQRFPVKEISTQQFPIKSGNINIPSIVAPSIADTKFTTSSEYLACLQSCPSTMEYNPICGTDRENYHNKGRLSCAQQCGKDVAILRMGTCAPL